MQEQEEFIYNSQQAEEIYTWIESLKDIPNHFYPSESIHEKKLDAFFGKQQLVEIDKLPQDVRNTTLLLICFTNRCGSNLLTELIHSTGLSVMKTYEPLNHDVIIQFCKKHQVTDFTSYLSDLVSRNSTKNLFGFKTGANQLFWMSRRGYLHIFNKLKFIHIKRRNLIDQAVSLYKATQNNQWHSNMVSKIPEEQLECNSFEVLKIIRGIIQSNCFFDYFFAIHDINYHTVYYEDLILNLDSSMKSILTYLELSEDDFCKPSLDLVDIRKQSSMFNNACVEDFMSRYKIVDNGIYS